MIPLRPVFLVSSLALVLGATACTPNKDKEPPKPKVSAAKAETALPMLGQAPAWQLKDLNGKLVTSEQFRGKVVVVDFWATWCGPCRHEIPGYAAMVKKYGKDGLVVVGISLDDVGPEIVKAFSEKFSINYPIVMGDEAVQTAFGGIQAMPTTFLIDRQGRVRDQKVGAMESAEYEKKVQAVLAES